MDERAERRGRWARAKIFAGLAGVGFAMTLAAVVGHRLSDEALAVLAGAVCGVGAAIPTSLLIVAVALRRQGEKHASPPVRQGRYPPVVVVTPQGGQQRFADWNGLPPSLTAPMERSFTVVGGEPANAEVRPYGRHS